MGGLLYLAKPMAATGGLISGSFLAMAFLAIVIILIFASCIKIVPQATALVIERLGGYQDTWHVGIHVKLPFIDRVAKRVTLKEQVADFPPQPVITKDNVSIRIDTVIFYQITDPKLYAYGVENPISALENLTATTLRNIIGDLELDETLTSRETINTQMRSTLDVATDPWGIKVNRVELKNIMCPPDIQGAMEKQATAESTILEAEAEKAAQILRAEAKKEATIREAEGQAQAILAVQKANADGIKLLNESAPSGEVIKLKGLEAFGRAADGKATKIIIPSEIQGLAGLVSGITEVASEAKKQVEA